MFLEKTILKKNLLKNNTFLLKNLKTLTKYYIKLLLKKKYEVLNNNKPYTKNDQKIIKYVITVKYYRTSTSITASEINGNVFFFCISKPSIIKRKRKINRKIDLQNLIKTLLNQCPFMFKKPIALHLINIGFRKKQILKSFLSFFILVVKIFNNTPHNGCRPAKRRRVKKRTKNFFLFPKTKQRKLFLKTIKSL